MPLRLSSIVFFFFDLIYTYYVVCMYGIEYANIFLFNDILSDMTAAIFCTTLVPYEHVFLGNYAMNSKRRYTMPHVCGT